MSYNLEATNLIIQDINIYDLKMSCAMYSLNIPSAVKDRCNQLKNYLFYSKC